MKCVGCGGKIEVTEERRQSLAKKLIILSCVALLANLISTLKGDVWMQVFSFAVMIFSGVASFWNWKRSESEKHGNKG